MAIFLDTSALVKLFIQEPGSADVRGIVESETRKYTSFLTHHEFVSALSKKTRTRELSASRAGEVVALFRRALLAHWIQIPYGEAVSVRSIELLERYGGDGLRTLDAFQLACHAEVSNAEFVVSDRVLAEIARRHGVPTRLVPAES